MASAIQLAAVVEPLNTTTMQLVFQANRTLSSLSSSYITCAIIEERCHTVNDRKCDRNTRQAVSHCHRDRLSHCQSGRTTCVSGNPVDDLLIPKHAVWRNRYHMVLHVNWMSCSDVMHLVDFSSWVKACSKNSSTASLRLQACSRLLRQGSCVAVQWGSSTRTLGGS